jgi:hypothetical protein
MKNTGKFVISLDFELLWGVFDKVDYHDKKKYFRTTRNIIPQILNIFSEYGIHSTWAVVGMLFNENWQEWNKNFPVITPDYNNQDLSAYNFGSGIQSEDTIELCFAKELIELISKTPGQEIGTHTYSHYYCLEDGQSLISFEADLKKSIELAGNMGIELKSLVFPRNQFNVDYLKVCHELGITNVRSNPSDWYWKNTQKDSLLDKVFRTGDAYFGKTNKSYSINDIKTENSQPLSQKASRLLRPYSTNKILNNLKLNRIKSEMTAAAKNKEIYHLWWHPHNFGNNPSENLNDLRIIFNHYSVCQERYNFQSATMREIGEFVS